MVFDLSQLGPYIGSVGFTMDGYHYGVDDVIRYPINTSDGERLDYLGLIEGTSYYHVTLDPSNILLHRYDRHQDRLSGFVATREKSRQGEITCYLDLTNDPDILRERITKMAQYPHKWEYSEVMVRMVRGCRAKALRTTGIPMEVYLRRMKEEGWNYA